MFVVDSFQKIIKKMFIEYFELFIYFIQYKRY